MSHLYAFKCGNASCVIAKRRYFLMKVGIAEDNGFPQVLSRLNQNSTRVENNLGITIDVPSVTNADTSNGSPARGRTLAGAHHHIISLSAVSDLQGHMNRPENVFTHYDADITSRYDDLAFILPFGADVDQVEAKAVESFVTLQLGPRLHSAQFREAVLASRALHQPDSNAAEINYTEFILCSETIFNDIRELFVTDNFYDVASLLNLLSTSTVAPNVSQPTIDRIIRWTDMHHQQRFITARVRQPAARVINIGMH